MSDELKVVINLKGTTASIGVATPECDPVFVPVEGDLASVLKSVPEVVEAAKQKWDSNPRYPKSDLPQPAPTPTRAAQTARPAPAPQNKFF